MEDKTGLTQGIDAPKKASQSIRFSALTAYNSTGFYMPSALLSGNPTRSKIVARSRESASAVTLSSNLLLTAPFLVLYLIQLVHHQLWRDELNAFGIALASPTLSSLFHHIHYEGHPWLWYELLWIIAHITVNPIGMKIFEGLIGISIYLVIGLASPFSRLEKVLIFLGYFISFEYTVLSRMYGLLLLLLVLYLKLRSGEDETAAPYATPAHRNRLLFGALLLGLMASADSLGVMLSGMLVCEYLCHRLLMHGPALPRRSVAWAGLLYVGLLGFAIWSAKPTADISWRTTGRLFSFASSNTHLLAAANNYIVMPYMPARPFHQGFFWNPEAELHVNALSLAMVLVLAAYWLIFRRRPNLLLLVGLAVLGGTLFGHLIIHGSMRHFGITFLAFFAALWILRAKVARLPVAAYILLCLLAIGGVIAGAQQWRRPFSEAEKTAAWIRANQPANIPIAGTPDTTVVSLAELLHRPVYMLDCGCSDTFLLFSKRRDHFDFPQIPQSIVTARSRLGISPFLLTSDIPLPAKTIAFVNGRGLAIRLLINFSEAQVNDENFFVYEVSDLPK
jgi:hypothetical protein